MTENDRDGIPPDSTVQRAVDHLTRRAIWTGATTTCRNCDSEVELRSSHYYVTVHRESTDADSDSRDVVFCSRPCAAEYFRS